MKKKLISAIPFFLIALIFCVNSAYGVMVEPDVLSRFRNVISVGKISGITIPEVVSMPISNPGNAVALYEEGTGRFLDTYINNASVGSTSIITLSTSSQDLSALHDGDSTTYFDVSSDGKPNSTTVLYTTPETFTTNSLKLNLAQYTKTPTTVTVYAYDPVTFKKKLVVYSGSLVSDTLYFPNSTAKSWEIIFNHSEPLRINEMEFVDNNPDIAQSIRFVAQPGQFYSLYINPEGVVNIPVSEQPLNLNSIVQVKNIASNVVQPNPLYKPNDLDGDGVIDAQDNCPDVKNTDQKHTNMSIPQGDVCADFDHDGIKSSLDNCPNIPNADQLDTDGDKSGDLCDPGESRLTEKYPWIPLVGIVIGFGATLLIFATTVKSKKK